MEYMRDKRISKCVLSFLSTEVLRRRDLGRLQELFPLRTDERILISTSLTLHFFISFCVYV